MSDLERLPTIDAVDRLNDNDASGAGSSFRVQQPGLVPAEFEVTERRPGTEFTREAPVPRIHTRVTRTLREQDDPTMLQLRIEWAGPLASLAKKLLPGKTRGFLALEAETFVPLTKAGIGR